MQAGLEEKSYFIVFVALAVSMLTLYSMTKIWIYVFWKKQPAEMERPLPTDKAGWIFRLTPIIILAVCTPRHEFGSTAYFECDYGRRQSTTRPEHVCAVGASGASTVKAE